MGGGFVGGRRQREAMEAERLRSETARAEAYAQLEAEDREMQFLMDEMKRLKKEEKKQDAQDRRRRKQDRIDFKARRYELRQKEKEDREAEAAAATAKALADKQRADGIVLNSDGEEEEEDPEAEAQREAEAARRLKKRCEKKAELGKFTGDVKILCASGLPKVDYWGKIDPYVVAIWNGEEIERTEVRKQSFRPRFDHHIKIPFHRNGENPAPPPDAELVLQVW